MNTTSILGKIPKCNTISAFRTDHHQEFLGGRVPIYYERNTKRVIVVVEPLTSKDILTSSKVFNLFDRRSIFVASKMATKSDWRIVAASNLAKKLKKRSIPLKFGDNHIGRNKVCDVQIPSIFCSKIHCNITVDGEFVTLIDRVRVAFIKASYNLCLGHLQ